MRLAKLAAAGRHLPARLDKRVGPGTDQVRRSAHLRGVRLHQILRSRRRREHGGIHRPLVIGSLLRLAGPLQRPANHEKTDREPDEEYELFHVRCSPPRALS